MQPNPTQEKRIVYIYFEKYNVFVNISFIRIQLPKKKYISEKKSTFLEKKYVIKVAGSRSIFLIIFNAGCYLLQSKETEYRPSDSVPFNFMAKSGLMYQSSWFTVTYITLTTIFFVRFLSTSSCSRRTISSTAQSAKRNPNSFNNCDPGFLKHAKSNISELNADPTLEKM